MRYGPTDRRTDQTSYRACFAQLKIRAHLHNVISDGGAKKKQDTKQIEEDLFGDASDISSDEEGKRKLKIHDSDSDAEKEDKPKKKKAKVCLCEWIQERKKRKLTQDKKGVEEKD